MGDLFSSGDSGGSSADANSATGAEESTFIDRLRFTINRRSQKLMDDMTPYMGARWLTTAVLAFLYVCRVWLVGGFFVVTYVLGIYLLNLFIGFLSPQVDPESEDTGGALPTTVDDEFRPYQRHLPELKFWRATTFATFVAVFCTFVPFLDIPVFWPILVIYFVALAGITLKNQIKHMIKHHYLPFIHGKPVYKVAPRSRDT
ncbi:RER1 protein [Pelomyxa schiedti]|nr:RER1 protein [Pelomyxa schiedti]